MLVKMNASMKVVQPMSGWRPIHFAAYAGVSDISDEEGVKGENAGLCLLREMISSPTGDKEDLVAETDGGVTPIGLALQQGNSLTAEHIQFLYEQ